MRRRPWDAALEADLGVDKEVFQRLLFCKPGPDRLSPMEECLVGRRDLKEALADVLPQAGYAGSADVFMAYWFEKDANFNPDVMALVMDFASRSGIDLYMATGQEKHRAQYLWVDLGLRHYFKGIFYSAQIGHLKKEPAFFETIDRLLKVDTRERPLFFDDRSEVLEVARQVGWDAVLFESADDIRNHSRLAPYL